jgi:RND family efflux transporter MFP subunit
MNIQKMTKPLCFKNIGVMNQISIFLFVFLFVGSISCSNKSKNTSVDNSDSTEISNQIAEVKVAPLKYSDFSKEIISNGKLKALYKSDLRFKNNSEIVSDIFFKNGMSVKKNQIIAKLDNFTLQNSLKQSQEQFERAKIELQDILIGQGYNAKDTTNIPKELLSVARIKSGYNKAIADLEMASYNLKVSELKAPFDGLIANLFSKANNLPPAGEAFCTVIDDSRLEVEFTILENELNTVKNGQTVRISPYAYADLTINGELTQINPFVDQNGMVKVIAVCDNPNHKLAEGMNVKIIIEEMIPNQLVIPKKALVLRSEKPVVFTLSSGLAKWNYVETSMENTTSFVIAKGLNVGDTIIYEGNLNLAHDARVMVVK